MLTKATYVHTFYQFFHLHDLIEDQMHETIIISMKELLSPALDETDIE